MIDPALQSAVASIPSGRWGVGVSGGADSVALLSLLRHRTDLRLHVVHLDHETRGEASRADAAFVRDLCLQWKIPHTLATRARMESSLPSLPRNRSARFRALRIALFTRVARQHDLTGVLLAHHADDRAETILHRLLRGSSFSGLDALRRESVIGGLRMVRPLLSVRSRLLRDYLKGIDQAWREDASNASPAYLRNRLRRMLTDQPDLTASLLDLGDACGRLRDWVRSAAPTLPDRFPAGQLARAGAFLSDESARRWLLSNGVPPDDLAQAVVDRLVAMACDAATPSRQDFPGRVRVRRRRGEIHCETTGDTSSR